MKIAIATKHDWRQVAGYAGKALADTRFDISTALCKLRDLFCTH
jgi:hypothetical protein